MYEHGPRRALWPETRVILTEVRTRISVELGFAHGP